LVLMISLNLDLVASSHDGLQAHCESSALTADYQFCSITAALGVAHHAARRNVKRQKHGWLHNTIGTTYLNRGPYDLWSSDPTQLKVSIR